MTLTPAYGRDYKSKAAVVADFEADKDFEVADLGSGRYTNRADLLAMGQDSVTIRYASLRKLMVMKVRAKPSDKPAGNVEVWAVGMPTKKDGGSS